MSSKDKDNGPEDQIEQNGVKEPKNDKGPTVTVTELELESVRKELTEIKDKYLRLLAESENARKRLIKEKQEMIQFSIINLIAEFLPPMDHLENALKYTDNLSEEIKHWAVGFQMISTQFKDVLAGNGVTPIEAKEAHFDPHLHEAVETIETDACDPGTIVEEFVKGYKMGEKLVRPSRVKVAKAPSSAKNEEKIKEN